MLKSNTKNILIILTGSIACYKACALISKLKQQGHSLKVVLSPSSLEFIGKSSIEGLTGEAPITDMYSVGHVMDHINLARWADLVLVAPATANYINKIAHGLGDDLLTTLFLAHDFQKPFLIAPAMNTKMYLHPTTQESLLKLKKMGIEILETASGVLACGEIGSGRLLEPDLIIAELNKFLSLDSGLIQSPIVKTSVPPVKILITAGGTVEPIDDVRTITNKSSGQTAARIADSLIESGFEVTFLHSLQSLKPQNPCTQISFETFNDLKSALEWQLTSCFYNIVIHAAAVSDYSVAPYSGKISSDAAELTLTLKRNPKLINTVKKLSPSSKLMGFKLTSTLDETTILQKVSALFESANCDWVIQNDWADIKNKIYNYRIFRKNNLNSEKINGPQLLNISIFQEIMKSQETL